MIFVQEKLKDIHVRKKNGIQLNHIFKLFWVITYFFKDNSRMGEITALDFGTCKLVKTTALTGLKVHSRYYLTIAVNNRHPNLIPEESSHLHFGLPIGRSAHINLLRILTYIFARPFH